jgi:tetratricopeptide (TPR) repeat protein
MEQMSRSNVWVALLALLLTGCATAPKQDSAVAAKGLFELTTKQYHLPSAEATGADRDRLLGAAATGYEKLLRTYRDQPFWCAQALRSLGNVRTAQGRLDAAIKLYRQVGEQYPGQEWEVVQAWKSAGDLLWDADRQEEAKAFYRQIVARFDQPDEPAIIRTVVRGAKARLWEGAR